MCKSTNLSDLATGGFPPPQLNRLIICRAWCCHQEPHGYQISPDTAGKLLLMITAPPLLLMKIFTQRRGLVCTCCSAAPCIYLHCKGADLTAFQFNCTWYCCVHEEKSQVQRSILKGCRSAQRVLMQYILGMDKSSKILTTNMGKKTRKNNKAREKIASKVLENGESKGSQG